VRENGSVFVLLNSDRVRYTADRPRHADDIPTDRPQHIDGTPGDISEDSGDLIASKDETIRILLEQLEAERTASAELRRIVAGLVQRVPELETAGEAAPEPRESSQTASENPGSGTTVHPDDRGAEKPSWWKRFFGFE
jgi:hypothetical protein